MATTEELIVTARWQGQQLEDGTRRTEDGMKRVRRATSEANGEIDKMDRAARTARNALAGLGMAFSAKAVLDYAESWTKVTNQLRLVSENVERTRAAVAKTALDTHSSLEGTATLYARLTRATQTLGYAEAQRIQLVATINNAMRVSGATAQESAAALIQLSQAFSSGRLAGEEFRAVSEQAPYLLDLLAEALNKTRGEIRQMALDQELTTEIMAEAWLRMSGKVQGEAAKMKLTVGQALEDLQTKLIEFIGAADDAAGGTTALAATIKSLADNLWLVQAALLAVGAAWATGGIAAMMKALGPLLGAGGAGTGMTAGGIVGVGVLATAVATKAGDDLYAQYGNTPTGAAITGGYFGLQQYRNAQIAAEEAAAAGEWVPVFKEVPKSVYAILEAEKLLHDFRLDAVTTTNDEASELQRLADAQDKRTKALRKSLEGQDVEPETRARLERELRTYHEFQTGLVKARQEEEAAAKAQTEAERAAAQAKRETAEFERAMAVADQVEARARESHRRKVADAEKILADSRQELAVASMTVEQREQALFDATSRQEEAVLGLTESGKALLPIYRLNRLAQRDVLVAEQERIAALKDEEEALKALALAQQVAVQKIAEVVGAVQSILGDLGRWLPGAGQLAGIAGSVGGLMTAQKLGSGWGMAAGSVGIVTGIMGLADSMWQSIYDGALRAEQAAAAAAEALRQFNAQLLSLAGQAGGGSVLALAQNQLMAPIRAMYEASLTNDQLAGAWGESATEVERAQRQIAALRTTLARLAEFDVAANWTPGGMDRPSPAVQLAMETLADQLGMSFADYLAAVQELFGTDTLADAAMQMFTTADAAETLTDALGNMGDALLRSVRLTYDMEEMIVRQRGAEQFRLAGADPYAQARAYQRMLAEIEALAEREQAALRAARAHEGGGIILPVTPPSFAPEQPEQATLSAEAAAVVERLVAALNAVGELPGIDSWPLSAEDFLDVTAWVPRRWSDVIEMGFLTSIAQKLPVDADDAIRIDPAVPRRWSDILTLDFLQSGTDRLPVAVDEAVMLEPAEPGAWSDLLKLPLAAAPLAVGLGMALQLLPADMAELGILDWSQGLTGLDDLAPLSWPWSKALLMMGGGLALAGGWSWDKILTLEALRPASRSWEKVLEMTGGGLAAAGGWSWDRILTLDKLPRLSWGWDRAVGMVGGGLAAAGGWTWDKVLGLGSLTRYSADWSHLLTLTGEGFAAAAGWTWNRVIGLSGLASFDADLGRVVRLVGAGFASAAGWTWNRVIGLSSLLPYDADLGKLVRPVGAGFASGAGWTWNRVLGLSSLLPYDADLGKVVKLVGAGFAAAAGWTWNRVLGLSSLLPYDADLGKLVNLVGFGFAAAAGWTWNRIIGLSSLLPYDADLGKLVKLIGGGFAAAAGWTWNRVVGFSSLLPFDADFGKLVRLVGSGFASALGWTWNRVLGLSSLDPFDADWGKLLNLMGHGFAAAVGWTWNRVLGLTSWSPFDADWSKVINPIGGGIAAAVGWTWNRVLGLTSWSPFDAEWGKVVNPVGGGFAAALGWTWNRVLGLTSWVPYDAAWDKVVNPVGGAIGSALGWTWDKIMGLSSLPRWALEWGDVIKLPDIDLGGWLKGKIADAWDAIRDIDLNPFSKPVVPTSKVVVDLSGAFEVTASAPAEVSFAAWSQLIALNMANATKIAVPLSLVLAFTAAAQLYAVTQWAALVVLNTTYAQRLSVPMSSVLSFYAVQQTFSTQYWQSLVNFVPPPFKIAVPVADIFTIDTRSPIVVSAAQIVNIDPLKLDIIAIVNQGIKDRKISLYYN